jgi:hypothetical protein
MCWWGDMDFLPHFLGLFRLRGLEAHLAFGPQPLRHPDRKALAAALQSGVVELLRRLEGGPPRPAVSTVSTATTATAVGPGATEVRA